MPRYAHTAAGNRVHVESASKQSSRQFACPYCKGDLLVAGGQDTQFRKHFRHRPNESCHEYEGAAETRRHLMGKSDIEYWVLESEWAEDIHVEQQIGPGRPDVSFTVDGMRVGVELQVSRMSAQEVRERTRERTAEDVHTLWLFDVGYYRSETESASSNAYVSFKSAEQAYLSLLGHPGQGYVHYFDAERTPSSFVTRYDVFDDGNGGWPEYGSPIEQVETFTTTAGFRLATAPRAVPETTGDSGQARLF